MRPALFVSALLLLACDPRGAFVGTFKGDLRGTLRWNGTSESLTETQTIRIDVDHKDGRRLRFLGGCVASATLATGGDFALEAKPCTPVYLGNCTFGTAIDRGTGTVSDDVLTLSYEGIGAGSCSWGGVVAEYKFGFKGTRVPEE